jgi:hypothetical protein
MQADRENRRKRRVRALVRQGQTTAAAEAIAAQEFAGIESGGGVEGEAGGL